jgi:hypothetical protein
MKQHVYALIIFCFINLVGCNNPREIPLSERYSGSWQEEFNIGISKLLVSKKISGCGQYKFRESSIDKNEYLVYCTSDGSNWAAYIVWPNIGEVTGPHTPDPSLL